MFVGATPVPCTQGMLVARYQEIRRVRPLCLPYTQKVKYYANAPRNPTTYRTSS